MRRELLKFSTEDDESFFRYYALLKKLPKDTVFISHASDQVKINPEVKSEAVLEKFSKFKKLWSAFSYHSDREGGVFLNQEKALIDVGYSKGKIMLDIYSPKDDAKAILEKLKKWFEKFVYESERKDGMWAEFVFHGPHAPKKKPEFIKCPKWKEISGNYPDEVSESLDSILKMREIHKRGHLLILHGEAGTGKTTFLRSMMMEWKDTSSFSIITDPERMTKDPGYYLNIAGRNREVYDYDDDDELLGFEEERNGRHKGKKNIFILEDAADLIIAGSRGPHFDKVGKFLNMTDGLFGQGREDIFIVTFNEAVEKIDPAFLRPGRCIGVVKFRTFEEAEAQRWLKERKIDDDVSGKKTLAELYQRFYKFEDKRPVRAEKVGF